MSNSLTSLGRSEYIPIEPEKSFKFMEIDGIQIYLII